MRIKYYYVYILLCADGSYYVGFSNNPYAREDEHNEGRCPKSYTFSRRPVKLVYIEAFSDPMEGIEREKQIKGWTRKKKEALIIRNIDTLHRLSKCCNNTDHTLYKLNKESSNVLRLRSA